MFCALHPNFAYYPQIHVAVMGNAGDAAAFSYTLHHLILEKEVWNLSFFSALTLPV